MIASSAVYLADLAPQRILTHNFAFIMELDQGGEEKETSFSHKHLDNCLLLQDEQLDTTSSEGAAMGLWSELWVSRWEGACRDLRCFQRSERKHWVSLGEAAGMAWVETEGVVWAASEQEQSRADDFSRNVPSLWVNVKQMSTIKFVKDHSLFSTSPPPKVEM